jgi:hypothetical protein
MFGPKHTFRLVVERLVSGLEDGSLHLPQEQGSIPDNSAFSSEDLECALDELKLLLGEDLEVEHETREERQGSSENGLALPRKHFLEMVSGEGEIKELAKSQPEIILRLGEMMSRCMMRAFRVTLDTASIESTEGGAGDDPEAAQCRSRAALKKKIQEAARSAVLTGLRGFLKNVGLIDPPAVDEGQEGEEQVRR